ncbi:MAG: ribonuclease R [Bacteroidetes bacterium]|nr:ribonuclease R [Bacteroidota bacterium]MCL5267146.1 ribonuclease R [Bacteroidota bacterium]
MKKTSRKTKPRNKVGDIKGEIQNFLKRNPAYTFKKRQLAKLLGYTSEHEYARFKQALRQLEQEGGVQQSGRRKFGGSQKVDTFTGSLAFERDGNLVFNPDKSESAGDVKLKFYVSQGGTGEASPGDKVRVKVVGGVGKALVVKVTEVLAHEEKVVVGTIERIGGSYKILLRSRDLPTSIDVSRKNLGSAKEGEKVAARLLVDAYGGFSAEVVSVLGKAGDPNVEIASIAAQFGLRKDFPREVAAEAHDVSDKISREEIGRRLDLRKEIIFTIDPEDARDFDDAVSLKKVSDELYELGVHIADVSHYVTPGSQLDSEAYKRGTSVYLTNGVIPMLPHKLSNEICSLNPEADRLAYSVIMQIRPTGGVVDYRFAKSVIRSKRRFTYEQVQKIIETGKGELVDTILEMNKLARTLTKIRSRAGSIDFDLPEAKFVFDELGRPVEIIKKMRLDSHRLVEEFMLLANKTVAMHIGRHGVKSKPFLYRVHDVPDPDRIRELSVFVSHFGYDLNYDGSVNQKQLQRLLQSVEGKPEEYLINDIMLRSMAKAIYSEKNIGHYGLAFKYYTHFTSPIRRYPDLVVHRLLNAYETGTETSNPRDLRRTLAEIAATSSEAERRAVEAERESVKVKQTQYMMEHVGDEFEGTVSGITSFGMFVEVDDVLVEGLVHVREMDDYYEFFQGKFQLRGRRSGKVFQLGDRVRVKVVRVNMERHEIDFVMV